MAADYWRSSQAHHWLLSIEELRISRLEDVRYAGSEDRVEAVSIWVANAISLMAKQFGLRQRVTATAMVFFHRFYAVPPNAYTNTDPCLVATACLYVAAKVEETPLHIRTLMTEAARAWADYGHTSFPSSSYHLAEMEFYLLRDLEYHLILHHPYRPLMAIAGAAGKTALEKVGSDAASSASSSNLGSQAEALGVGSSNLGGVNSDMAAINQAAANGAQSSDLGLGQNDAVEEEQARKAMTAGLDGMPIAQASEIDENVVHMAWAILNDSYRHAWLHLLYPPHILAVSALFLGLVLNESSRTKMLASIKQLQSRRLSKEKQRNASREEWKAERAADMSGKDHQKERTALRGAGLKMSGDGAASPLATGNSQMSSGQLATSRSGQGPQRPGLNHTGGHLNGSSGNFARSANGFGYSKPTNSEASAIDEADVTPPADVLTFLATLNIAHTSQLAACIQGILDGYAVWARVAPEIETWEGSKTVLGWLDAWRTKRVEELRVMELEAADRE